MNDIFPFREEIILSGILNEFKENVRYIYVASEVDAKHQETRVHVQIILGQPTQKGRRFLELHTCK